MTSDSSDRCVHHLFEAQVARTPAATAVVYQGTGLTYELLNRRANQLAHYLRSRGIGAEVLVGLCLERSLEMIVGVLGVLKAGGAYVPLDPTYPHERLAFMTKDARLSLVLTQEPLAGRLAMHGADVVRLDADWEVIARESTEDPRVAVTPENLACVLYTSGSTGIPKGVMLEHRSVAHYTETASTAFALGPDDRVLQFASLSFDTSLEEIFPCLSRGATLVLRDGAMVESLSVFLQECRDQALTVLDLPTGYWHELTIKLGRMEQFAFGPSVRLVIIGGEKALREQLRAWQKHVGHRIRLMNTYGPTETTVVATMCELSGAVEATSRDVPIGRAVRGVQTYVLDQHLQPVPEGEPGELHIGGIGLARGYLNRPELTAEKFIPDPFAAIPGARLYRTGDVVRCLPDGTFEYHGRIDRQIKIHGFRIEPGEIETLLSRHPAVQQVVVAAHEERAGVNRLVAYVVPHQKGAVTVSDIQRFLRPKVPAYMVPSAVVWLDALPLTPNGKIDRRALPAPDLIRRDLKKVHVAPRDALERQLVRLWEKALGTTPVGVLDNFFELGGRSLLAVRLCEQMEQKFGKDLSPATLFQAPTIEQVANILRHSVEVPLSWSLVVPFQATGSRPPFFCLFGSAALALQLGSDQPVYTLQPHGLAGLQAPTTVEAAAADYLKEIRAVQPEGPYFLGGFSFGGLVAFELAHQLAKQGQQIALLALLDPVSLPSHQTSPPATTALPGGAPSRRRMTRHARALALLGPKEQLAYVFEKVRGRLAVANKAAQRAVCDGCLALGRRVPFSLREFYFQETSDEVIQQYVPRVYRGPVVFFRTQSSSPHLYTEWRSLITGDLQVYDLPGNHYESISDPYVRIAAAKLGACLARVQHTAIEVGRCHPESLSV
jgi:amino acid adenylation domain-containing protein